MIKININGNRSDIIGYVSYYSCEEISKLLEINPDEIIYETAVVDYFMHGDITFDSEIVVKVTLTDNYLEHVETLTNIIVKYVSYFTNKCKVYYEVIDSRLVYLYESKEKKENEHEHECHCHCHHEESDHECHCHEENDSCGCKEGHECHCHEKECSCGCKEGHECHCDDEECFCHHDEV